MGASKEEQDELSSGAFYYSQNETIPITNTALNVSNNDASVHFGSGALKIQLANHTMELDKAD